MSRFALLSAALLVGFVVAPPAAAAAVTLPNVVVDQEQLPEMSATPEPVPDPMTQFAMWVVPARRGTVPAKKMLSSTDTNEICPSDYPTGLSIQCTGPFTTARFAINGDSDGKEMKAPFMLFGDYEGFVNPWEDPSGTVTVACKSQGERLQVAISFKC